MSGTELIYFDVPGRAEAARILFHAAGVDFEDTRVSFSEWKDTVKPTTPLGSLPVLKIGGTQHVQSLAIARYAARLAGCYPDDPLEALKVDEVCDTLSEMMSKAPKSDDVEEMKKLRKNFQETTMDKYASFIDNLIVENGGTYVTGPSMTLADIVLDVAVKIIENGKMWDYIDSDFWSKYKSIMATVKAVREDDKVVAYYASKK